MKRKILICGRSGQMAQALARTWPRDKYDLTLLSQLECNFSHPREVVKVIDLHKPNLIINCAAYTAVDRAETDVDRAMNINCASPTRIAQYCADNQIPLIHFSTDYVYEGSGEALWTENSPTFPLNQYGRTKLAGEHGILSTKAPAVILRTSWLYDWRGQNFFLTMLRLGQDRPELRIVDDQVGAPTYCGHLAEATWNIVEQCLVLIPFPGGVYNLAQTGTCSWYEFAREILDKAREAGVPIIVRDIHPIATKDFPTPAKRPQNSRLNLDKIQKTFGIQLPHWTDGLKACFDQWLKESKNATLTLSP